MHQGKKHLVKNCTTEKRERENMNFKKKKLAFYILFIANIFNYIGKESMQRELLPPKIAFSDHRTSALLHHVILNRMAVLVENTDGGKKRRELKVEP